MSKIIPGITPEQLDGIMNLHGADITAKADAASQVAALEKGYALERKASGLTQLELAEKLGVITGTIGYYERGAGQPKTDNLFALCDILHIRPADPLRADP